MLHCLYEHELLIASNRIRWMKNSKKKKEEKKNTETKFMNIEAV